MQRVTPEIQILGLGTVWGLTHPPHRVPKPAGTEQLEHRAKESCWLKQLCSMPEIWILGLQNTLGAPSLLC